MYHPVVYEKKRNDIRTCLEGIQTKELKIHQKAYQLIEESKECEIKLIELITKQRKNVETEEIFSLHMVTLYHFNLFHLLLLI